MDPTEWTKTLSPILQAKGKTPKTKTRMKLKLNFLHEVRGKNRSILGRNYHHGILHRFRLLQQRTLFLYSPLHHVMKSQNWRNSKTYSQFNLQSSRLIGAIVVYNSRSMVNFNSINTWKVTMKLTNQVVCWKSIKNIPSYYTFFPSLSGRRSDSGIQMYNSQSQSIFDFDDWFHDNFESNWVISFHIFYVPHINS